ncbi:SAGA-associated factor 29 homolog A-like [Arachis hypogaea]|uniref:SAGA-associated factor 29 homolog A-like n=1 Tax=Arachis hypogaea TaxID=3818 RepID=UPI000DECC423|nr:SAGA-associated factor 29 homolog A-like [Arachis hypogaea]
MSSPNIAAMLDKTEELDLIIKEQEVILLKINDLNEKLKTSPQVVENPDDNSLELLKVWYTQAMNLSNCEANICDLLANQLDALLELQQPSPPLPRLPPLPQQQKRMAKARVEQPKRQKQVKSLSNPSSITGSLEGKEVAAKVMPQIFEKEEWIIARVVCFDEESKEFEVVDEEPDNGDAKEVESGEKKYKVPMRSIIPFPSSNDPTSAPEFSPGTYVLAVYPGTTTLYKARVVRGHNKRKKHDYVLEFDDDENEDGTLPKRKVPFHKVVAFIAEVDGQ